MIVSIFRRFFPRGLVLAALVFASTGAAQPTPDYQIGPKDLVEVKCAEVPDLNLERRVQDGGAIDLPLLGQVPVAGSTAFEVRDRITALLTAKYVNQAYVTVTVKEFANRPITLLGGVLKPGALNVAGRWTIQQAILAAGGISPSAGKKISILRTAENGLTDRIEVNSDEVFVRGDQRWNLPVIPGDIVSVSVRETITIFCLGEMKTTGAITFQSEDRITMLKLVARAGGFTDRAAKGSIRIRRTDADGKQLDIPVNYNRILSGKDPDVLLQPDDIVIVKESLI